MGGDTGLLRGVNVEGVSGEVQEVGESTESGGNRSQRKSPRVHRARKLLRHAIRE